jgi:N-acetyl-gamma-glutamyl-phosphate reductase
MQARCIIIQSRCAFILEDTELKKHVVNVSVIGARGYVGLETARLLLHHPNADLKYCFATSEFKLEPYLSSPAAAKVICLPDSEIMNHLTDVVFLATPAEVSLKLAPQILAAGKKVIDLSGAFRLKHNDYKKWYGFEHTESQLLAKAQYGLAPWVGPASESLIANPGCYATAITMALIPLVKNNLINAEQIVIDAKSGTSGAGKKASENLLFTEVDGECLPYKVGAHQHYPEIQEVIEFYTGQKVDAHMTTSLLSVRRGIIAGIYAHLKDGAAVEDVEQAYAKAYADYPLVKFARAMDGSLLSLKKVVGTGKTHISYEVKENKLYLFSCIDNLLKGAASQAVENFNRISDLPLWTGVSHLEAVT